MQLNLINDISGHKQFQDIVKKMDDLQEELNRVNSANKNINDELIATKQCKD